MIYIRTDMNCTIATGHIMRCLSVADALKEVGEKTTFILADTQAKELLESRGYDFIVLNTKWYKMEEELPVLTEIIKEKKIETILIDSYQVTSKYLSEVNKWTRTVYLDDLNSFQYQVKEIICYANYAHKFAYDCKNKDIKIYRGTKYVPLRREFWDLKEKNISEHVEKLLLLSGGTDPYNMLGSILDELDRKKYECIDVICGAYNERYHELVEKYASENNVLIHRAVSNMQDFMKKADLVISAGGTTLYELCACGTPTISYSFVDNQLNNVKQFQEDGMIDYAGDARYCDVARQVRKMVEKYGDDCELRKKQSHCMQQLVDGKGALRIAEILKTKS